MKTGRTKTVSESSVSSKKDYSHDRVPQGITISDSQLLKILKNGEFTIAVYGLGHVGSPLASVWLRAGAHVIGVDRSPKVLENAKKGRTHVPEPGVNEAFAKGLKDKHFRVYDDPVKASQDSQFKMICVPVLSSSGSADLTAVRDVATSIGKGLKKKDVVSLNPSVPPGTTEDVIIPILEKESGLKVEKDFYMIYNPERIYEGRVIEDIEERYPAVVSGAGPLSIDFAAKLYSIISKKGVIKMTSIKAAETEKLFEGVFRDVNIALANELAKFCEKAGVDFWEVRDAANSQPFCYIHKPGAGVGGACIPVYPQFILHTADRLKADCNITRLGRSVNDSMPAHTVRQALKLLSPDLNVEENLNLRGVTVTILGVAFRGGVSDTRLSPTYDIIKELKRLGVKEIRVHDPMVESDPNLPADVILTKDLSQAVKNSDLVILATDHKVYKTFSSKEFGDLPLYDGRGILDVSKFVPGRFASVGRG